MKKILMTLVVALIATIGAKADEVVYDFSKSIPAGWELSEAQNGFETASPARGAQFTKSCTLTLKGVSDVTKVDIVCSANTTLNTLSVAVGGKTFGTETLPKENHMTQTFSSQATSGDLVVTITRAEKSVYIEKITITGTAPGGNTGGGGGEEPVTQLDETYSYAEPTTIGVSGATCSNTSYSFVQNNILVETTAGAQTSTYFGCNAGNSITFTATKNLKALVVKGYVKKDFSASATSGEIAYVDAYESEIEADPVLIVTDINAKSVTINCDKQMRCYSVSFYFEANPDVEIDNPSIDDGDYTYSYEPTTPSNFDITFDEMEYADFSEALGYNYTDVYLVSEDYEMEIAVFAPSASGTGLAPGTYAINDTYDDGTAQASPGGDEYYDYPTYMATGFEFDYDYEAWYYTKAYYLVSGTITVAADPAGVKLTIDGKTYYGSTIKATFTGQPVDTFGDDPDGIIDVTTAADDASVRKILRGNRIEIHKNGKRFSTVGEQL